VTKSTILVPVDGSEYSLRALDVAIDLAHRLDAGIVVCHVVDLSKAAALSAGEPQLVEGCLEMLESDGRHIVEAAVQRIGTTVPASSRVVEGAPVDEIQRLAVEFEPLFVVIGSHGRTGLNRLIVGSVAEGVVRGSVVPVMIVPPEKHPAQANEPHAETSHNA
jgi:nucleotide-binding universal stress UspA family protein